MGSDQLRRQRPWDTDVAVPLEPTEQFTKQEHWAWARIIRGQVADMKFYPGDTAVVGTTDWLAGKYDGDGEDPQETKDWKEHRILRESFLRTILFHEPWASAPDAPGVRINAARIVGELNWIGFATVGDLWLDCCVIESDFVWQNGHVRGVLSLDGTLLNGVLNADGLRVEKSLFCRDIRATKEVRLVGAVCAAAEFDRAALQDMLQADSFRVDGPLFLRDALQIEDVDLIAAKIGSDLQLRGSAINGLIDLSGTRIGGELHLDHSKGAGPEWGVDGKLCLRNVRASALAGGLKSLRRSDGTFVQCDLSGFRYEQLGGLGAGGLGSTLASAKGNELRKWLKACREKSHFDPDPYRTLAEALEAAGRGDRAADVRNALGNYEFKAKGTQTLKRVLLAFSWLFIGYGERNHRAFMWFAALVLVAAAVGVWTQIRFPMDAPPVTWTSGRAWLDWSGFAFGSALPLITLDASHATFLADRFCAERLADGRCGRGDIPLGLSAWFYFVKILGFVILSYLAAGLSGWAQRGKR